MEKKPPFYVAKETFETTRLILRPWQESDAEECYRYAKDPLVGPICGWPPHKDVENSRQIIRDMLMKSDHYCIVWKETGLPIGCIGLKLAGENDFSEDDDQCEMGFWLGVPYWGKGIMPEAAAAILRHGFEDLKMKKIWCAYYDGNEKSKRCQEKCGFRYQWTTKDIEVPQMNEVRIGHVNCMTVEEWRENRR
ncbi:MAG TPA: GNAT family N-acetyltransferase [Bacillota bacterium]|nr:GNAT family N-acetyltransferase [Bacillota bacterium]